MASRVLYMLPKRQQGQGGLYSPGDDGDDYDGYSWWWSPTGMAVRYTIVLLLFASILIFLIGGYFHARRRIRKGLQPLPYHRWMVRSFYQQPQNAARYSRAPRPAPENYDMHNYPPPPPAYNHNEIPPPVYQPPEGATKAMADQNFHRTQTYRAGENSASSQAVTTPAVARQ